MGLPADWLEILKREYPRRDGPHWWLRVRTLLPQSLSAGAKWEDILEGTRAYRGYCDRQGITGTAYVKPACNWFDYRTQGWTEDYAPPPKPKSPQDLRQEARWAGLQARAAAIGFRGPSAVESADVYETVLRRVEREHAETCPSSAKNDPASVVTLLVKEKRA
jgi:hypothetical protein